MNTVLSIIFIGVLILHFAGIIAAGLSNKKEFNHGYCRECNRKLRFFDTDSQGGRGYCCDNCGKTIWM